MGITLTDPDDKDEPEEYLRLESEIRKEWRHTDSENLRLSTHRLSDRIHQKLTFSRNIRRIRRIFHFLFTRLYKKALAFPCFL